ncbi:hypothetical protein OFN97_04930, partial [Campylobacter sp. VBCF_05 NA6]|uniref:hypothetical protein n=1 Tax=unclassified Campylobacter TaxID=2593542 RepID=UPI0022E9CA90
MNKVYKLKRSSHGVKVVSEIAKGHSGEKTVREGFGSTIFSGIGKIASAPALGRLAMSLATIVAISAPFAPEGLYAEIVEGTSTGTNTIAIGKDSYVRANNGIAVGTDAKAGHKLTDMYIQASFINDNNPTKVMVKAYTTAQLAEMGITGATKTYYYAYYMKSGNEIKVGGLDRDKDLYKNKDINGELKSELLRAYAFDSSESYTNLNQNWVAGNGDTDADVAAHVAQFIYNNRNSSEKEIGDPNRFFSDKVVIAGSDGTQIAIGPNSYAMDKGAVALGNSATANGDYTIAIGEEAMAATMQDWSGGNIAIGGKAKAVEMNSEDENDRPGQSTAVGYSAFATGGQAMALGANTIASGYGSISIGGDDIGGTKSDFKLGKIGEYLYVIGGEEHATDHIKILQGIFNGDLVVVGKKIQVNENRTEAQQTEIKAKYGDLIGELAEGNLYIPTTASGLGSMAVGQSSVASNTFSNAFGYMDIANGIGASAIGTYNVVDGHGSTAVGAENTIVDVNSTAIGVINTISGGSTNAMATGNGNIVEGSNFSIAAGYYNENHGDSTITVGLYNDANATSAAAVGLSNYALGEGAIAVGGKNVAQGDYSTAFGLKNNATADNTLAIGTLNNATAMNSMALGADNNTTAEFSVAAGMSNVAEGMQSAALGFKNTASAAKSFSVGMDNNVTVTGVESIAHGYGNTVSGKNSIAMGSGNTVTGNRSGAFGDPNIIDSDDSYVVGNNSKIKEGDNSVFILGNKVTNTYKNSVFLGDGAAYETGKTSASMDTYSTNSVAIGKIAANKLSFAGAKPEGVVSIGNATAPRRIQNVAAGLISADSTDAINGSQLYSVIENLPSGGSITSDDRVVRIDNDKIVSPYIHINGVAGAPATSAQATGTNAVAIGANSQANGDNSTAFMGTTATGENAMTWGTGVSAGGYTEQVKISDYETHDLYLRGGDGSNKDKIGYVLPGPSKYDPNTCMTATLYFVDDNNKETGEYECVGNWFLTPDRIVEANAQVEMRTSHVEVTNIAGGKNATAFGYNTIAGGDQSTAFGEATHAGVKYQYDNKDVTPIQKTIKLEDGTEVVAWVLMKEDGTYVEGFDSQASSRDRRAENGELYYMNRDKMMSSINKVVAGKNATAFGEGTNASGDNSTAFGYRTIASGTRATAWGHQTIASGKRATAFGMETQATGSQSTAFGYRTISSSENSVAWGSNTEAYGIGSTAWGSHTKSAGDNSTAWGRESLVSAGAMTYGGKDYTDVTIEIKIEKVPSPGDPSVTINTGYYFVQGKDEEGNIVTIYDNNQNWLWKESGDTDLDQRKEIAKWILNNNGSLAADFSTAFGDGSKVYAPNALGALGGIIEGKAENSAAIGKGATVSVADTIALGSGSVANRDNVVTLSSFDENRTYKGYDVQTRTAGKDNLKMPDNAVWIGTANAIAVGNIDKNVTRQITGLAAGSEDTDAVNVAQLKRAVSGAGTVWSVGIDKDGTGTNKDGTLTFGKHTVGTEDYNKTGLDFIAGDNVDISYVELSTDNNKTASAYGIKFSAKDTNVTSKNGSVIITSEYNADTMTTGYDLKVPVKLTDNNGTIKLVSYGIDGDENSSRPVKITNLAPGEADTDAVNVSQLKEAAEGNRTYLTVNGGTEAPKTPGQYTDGNLKLTHGGEDNNTYDLKLANNLTIGEKGDGTPGKPGEDGQIKVIDKNGKDGVTIGAKDGEGTIGINGKDGKDAQITVAKGKDTLDNKEPGRIIYKTTNNEGNEITLQVATMDDGLKFEGNYRDGTNDPIAKKLNEQLNIEGTHTAGKDQLTTGNIGVINDGTKLVVELAKDVNLTESGSIYFGKDGAKISNDNGDIKVGDKNEGPVKITNLAPGEADTDAVNVSQLKEAAEGNRTYLTVNGGTEAPKT